MKKNDFTQALELMSENHTTKLVINQPTGCFVGKLGQTRWTIHITECVPAVVDKLIQAGYMLSMTEYGLLVEKI